jgi:hypothetical protein
MMVAAEARLTKRPRLSVDIPSDFWIDRRFSTKDAYQEG